jgi:cytochrome b pre-mRNA-processing protein 3
MQPRTHRFNGADMLRKWLQRVRPDERSRALYAKIVAQARQPAFYMNGTAADTPDGRFDMIILHAVLVMRRLRREGAEGRALAQDLFDTLFADMDSSLREMGVSDMSVPRRIKSMAAAFYGRAAAYGAALDAGSLEDLGEALERNLCAEPGQGAGSAAMTAYVFDCERKLAAAPAGEVLAAEIGWPAPPAVEGAKATSQ